MVLEYCYDKKNDKKLDGNGAHKNAKITIPTYANFLLRDKGDTSSNGVALGFRALMTRIKIAINQ